MKEAFATHVSKSALLPDDAHLIYNAHLFI